MKSKRKCPNLPAAQMVDELLTIDQAAKLLNVSTKTMRRWDMTGRLSPQRTVGNHRRYSKFAVEAFQKQRGNVAPASEKGSAATPAAQAATAAAAASPTGTPSMASLLTAQDDDPASAAADAEAEEKLEGAGYKEPAIALEEERSGMHLPNLNLTKRGRFMVMSGIVSMIFLTLVAVFNVPHIRMFAQARDSVLSALPGAKEAPISLSTGALIAQNPQNTNKQDQEFTLKVNVPGIFGKKVTFLEDAEVKKTLRVGGKLIAPNVIYSITAGQNVSISGDPQNPVISANLAGIPKSVLSVQGLNGDVQFLEGEGISLAGTTITNSDPGSAQTIFKNFTIDGSTTIVADANDDTINFAAGSGVTLTGDSGSKTITITSTAGGLSGLTTNGVLYATSSTVVNTTSPPIAGQVLLGNNSGVPTFTALSGDLGVNGNGVVTISPDSVTLGTDTTGNYQAATIAGNGITVTGTAGEGWIPSVAINLTSSGASALTSSNSGLEVTSSGLSLIHGCSNGQLLKWNTTTSLWECSNDATGSGGSSGIDTITGNSFSSTTSTTLNFSNDFGLTEAPLTQTNVAIDYTTSHITRDNQAQSITGLWNFANRVGVGTLSPTAQLDVQGTYGGNAAAIINQQNTGNILVASSSGTTRFTIANNGNLVATGGLSGLTSLTSAGTITFSGLGTGVVHSSSGVLSSSAVLNSELQNSSVTINTGTGLSGGGSVALGASLNLTNTGVTSLSGTSNQVNVSGATGAVTLSLPQDINTSSSPTFNGLSISSLTRGTDTITDFTGAGLQVVGNALETTLGTSVDLASEVSGTLGVTNGGSGFSSYSTGDLLYASGTTTLAKRAIGTNGQILTVSGGLPTWMDVGGTINFWQRNTGVLSPLAITDDLAVGGTATSSAKFQVFGLTGNATTSGTLTFNTTGTVQTTKNQTLTFGGNSTGNIVFSPLNGSGTVSVNGNVNLASGNVYQINGATVLSNSALGSGVVSSSLTSVGTLNGGAISSGFGNIDVGVDSIAGGDFTSVGTTGLTLTGNGADIAFSGTGNHDITASSGVLGLGALTLNGTVTGNNQNITGLNNLSAGGTVTFGGFSSNGGVLYTNGSGVLAQATAGTSTQVLHGGTNPSFGAVALGTDVSGTLPIGNGGTNTGSIGSAGSIAYSTGTAYGFSGVGTAGQILVSGGGGAPTWTDAGGTVNFWQRANGVLSPLAIADDLAVGGTATSSAKFQVFGLTGNATSSGTLTFNSAGVIQTTKNQTLTFGGSSTGNIVFSPLNGSGTVSVNGIMNLASGNVYQINGTAVLSNNTLGSGVTTSSLTTVGALASGSIAAGFGTIATNNSISGSALGISGTTVIDASRNLSNIAGVTTDLIPTTNNTYSLGTGSNQYLNVYGQTLYQNGNQVCDTSGNCSGQAVTYWNQTNGAIVPKNTTVDLLVGGTATGSAKFAVLNVNSGVPTASVSALTNGGAYLTAGGTLATTNKQTLTLGSSSTGNIALNGFGAGVLHTNASGVLSTSAVSLTSDVTGTLGTGNGGTGFSTYAQGDLLYGNGGTTLSKLAIGTAGQILAVSGGVPVWTDAGGTVNFWQRGSGVVAPLNITDDLLLGATGTSSAKFAFKNVAGGTPTASISGSTANVAAYFDGNGNLGTTNAQTLTLGTASTGNILLSPGGSGVIQFFNGNNTITSGGAMTLASNLTVNGTTVSLGNGSNAAIQTSSNANLSLLSSGSGNVVLGQNTGNGTVVVQPNAGGQAALIVNKQGNNDIFTASAAGTTRFVIANNGTLTASAYGTGVAKFNGSGVLSSGTIDLSSSSFVANTLGAGNGGTGFNTYTQGDLLYGNGGSTLSKLGIGNAGQILTVSGGVPVWSDAGGTINFWQRGSGVVAPLNITDDLAVGGNATSSAKFQVFGLTGNATTSGNLTFNSAGVIQTTKNQTLTIGGSSTGNIVFSPLNGSGTVTVNGTVNLASGSVYQINGSTVLSNNTLGSGVTSSSLTSVGALASGSIAAGFGTIATNNSISGSTLGISGTTVIDASRNFTNIAGVATDLTPTTNNSRSLGTSGFQYLNVYGQTLYQNGNQVCDTGGNCSGLSVNFWDQTNGALMAKNTTVDLLIGGSATGSAKFAVLNMNSGVPTASVSAIANGGAYLTADGTLATTNKQTLTLGSSSTGNIALNGFTTGVLHTNASGVLSSSAVALTTDVSGILPTANGGTGFNSYAQGDLIYGNGSGGLSKLTLGGPNQYLAAIGGNLVWTDVGNSINFWQRGAGYVAPLNITDDLLLGSTATGSAKFAFKNVSGGTPTASISASSGNIATYLTGDGSLGTTNGQTLTLGTSSTGNVALSPGGVTALTTYANGNVRLNNYTSNGGLLYTDGSGTVAQLADVALGSCLISGGVGAAPSWGSCATGTTNYWQQTSGSLAPSTTTDKLILGGGTTTNHQLEVNGKITGKALVSLNETGNQNIFTASASGVTRFTIGNNGTLTASAYSTGVAKFDVNGVLASGTLDLSSSSYVANTLGTTNGGTGFNTYTQGDLLYGNGSSTLSKLGIGSAGQILTVSGGVPVWSDAGGTINFWQRGTGIVAPLNITDDLLLGGVSTNSAKFAFINNIGSGTPTASISGTTANVRTYIDGDGNIGTTNKQTLTIGSASTGNIVFSASNSIRIAAAGSGIIHANGSGVLSSSAVNLASEVTGTLPTGNGGTGFSSYSQGDLLVGNGGSSLSKLGIGSSGQILTVSGGTAVWTDAGGTINFWQRNAGAVAPLNITDDLLLGGTATTSAKFAFINNIGSGTPTASISAGVNGALSMTAAGVIGTTVNQSLTLGSASTGNLVFAPGGSTAFTAFSNGRIGVGTTSPLATLDIRGNANSIPVASISGVTGKAALVVDQSGNGDIFTASSSGQNRFVIASNGNVGIGKAIPAFPLDVVGSINSTGTLSVTNGITVNGSSALVRASNYLQINNTATANQGITFFTTNQVERGRFDGTTGAFGVGTNSPLTTLHVAGDNSAGRAAFIVDQTAASGNDILTASASGATRLTLGNNGNLSVNSANGSDLFNFLTGSLKVGNASPTNALDGEDLFVEGGLEADGAVRFDNSSIVLGNAGFANCGMLTTSSNTLTCSSAPTGVNYWQLNSGTVSPFSNTLDLLIGGTATASAKFAFTGVNSGTPTASISGTTANVATYLDGNGNLSTTNAHTLTLGGSSTGNITLSPAGGSGTVNSTGNLSLASGKVFQIAGSGDVLSGSTLGTTVVTSSLTTVGALNAGSITNGFGAIDIGNDNLTAGGTITFSGLGQGIAHLSSGGVLSSSAIALGSTDVSGTLAVTNGGTGTGTSFTQGSVVFAGASGIYSQDNANFFFDDSLNRFGVGVNSNLAAALDVRTTSGTQPTASFSGATSRAAVVVDQSGVGDIFTASKSGATKFVINNAGNVQINNLSTGVAHVSATGVLSSSSIVNGDLASGSFTNITGVGTLTAGTWTATAIGTQYGGTGQNFSGIAQGAIPYFSGTGVMSTIAAGTNTQCLIGGTTPTWGSCATGTTNYWQENSGAVAPTNITDDLLLGSTATTSAKFAFKNVAGGTPTASISANSGNNATYLQGDGFLGTTNARTLTLGTSSTGNVVIAPGGVTALTAAGANLTGAGTFTSTGLLTANAGITITGGTANINSSGSSNTSIGNGTGTVALTLGSDARGDIFYRNNTGTLSRLAIGASNTFLTGGTDPSWTAGYVNDATNGTLTRSGSGPYTLGLNLGSVNTWTATQTLNAGATIANSSTFTVNSGSAVNLANLASANNSVLFADNSANGVLSKVAATSTANLCLLSGATSPSWGSCDASAGINLWQTLAGALSPKDSTADLLVGGSATSSAKFRFINVNAGTPTASISGTTANVTTYLDGNGNLGTTRATTLTLGSASTGNVLLSPGGSGVVQFFSGSNTITSAGAMTLASNLTVNGTTVSLGNGSAATIQTSSNAALNLLSSGTGNISLGQNSGNGTVLIQPNAGGQAALIINKQGVNDLLTASAAGTTKFVVSNAGNLSLAANTAIDTLSSGTLSIGGTNTTTLTLGQSGQVINLPGYASANNSVLFAGNTASGVLTKVAATSTANLCLLSGATTPSWGSCDTSPGINLWQVLAGALSPRDTTSDMLIGGTATSSAKFAFTGVNAGTPTASISGASNVATYLDANGNLGTTKATTLTLGSASTGNVLLSPGGSGVVQFFNGNNTITSAGAMTLASNLTVNGTTVNLGNGSTATIQTSSNAGLNLLSSGTGNISLGQNTGNGTVLIQPNAGGQAALIVNKQGNNDIFTASAAGTTRFTIQSTGKVVIGDATNGITFDPSGAVTAVYNGNSRPTKTITLSPEYSGAVLTASGSGSTVGIMTSDASPSANFRNYYQWISTQTGALQDYTVAVRVTLPKDFGAWTTTNAFLMDIYTNLSNTTDNKIDLIAYKVSDGSVVFVKQNQRSSTSKVWAQAAIDASGMQTLSAGDTIVIYAKMSSWKSFDAMIGDITLNYLAKF